MAFDVDVSSIEAALRPVGASLAQGLHVSSQRGIFQQQQRNVAAPRANTRRFGDIVDGGSCLAHGSAADLDSLKKAGIFNAHSCSDKTLLDRSLAKRKREASQSDINQDISHALEGSSWKKGSSGQMLPPPVPLHRPITFKANAPIADTLDARPLDSRLQSRPDLETTRSQFSPNDIACLTNTSAPPTEPHRGESDLAQAIDLSHRANPDTGVYHGDGAHLVQKINKQLQSDLQPQQYSDEKNFESGYASRASPKSAIRHIPADRAKQYQFGNTTVPIVFSDQGIGQLKSHIHPSSSVGLVNDGKNEAAVVGRSQLRTPSHSGDDVTPSREGRITLCRPPSYSGSFSTGRGIGLSSHIRSSNRRAIGSHAAPGGHRQRLGLGLPTPTQQVPIASPYFSHQLIPGNREALIGDQNTESLSRNGFWTTDRSPTNGLMRVYPSGNGADLPMGQTPRGISGGDKSSLHSLASLHRPRAHR